MKVKYFYDAITSTFSYLIIDQESSKCAIIDSVLDYNIYTGKFKTTNADIIIDYIKNNNLKCEWILETHIHADHITGASKLNKETNCTTIMGEHTLADAVEIKVKHDEIIKLDNLQIKAIYTPGHTSDSYSFLMNNYLFSGDTLLINGTGRTDFQNGNSRDAYESIFNKLLILPEETFLYPAHDYNGKKVSSLSKEKKNNPRLQVKSVDEYIEIMNNLNLPKPTLMDINVSRNIKLGDI